MTLKKKTPAKEYKKELQVTACDIWLESLCFIVIWKATWGDESFDSKILTFSELNVFGGLDQINF